MDDKQFVILIAAIIQRTGQQPETAIDKAVALREAAQKACQACGQQRWQHNPDADHYFQQ